MIRRILPFTAMFVLLPACSDQPHMMGDADVPPPPPPQSDIVVLVPFQSPWSETMRAPVLLNRMMVTNTDRVLSAVSNACTYEAMFGPLALNTPNTGQATPTTGSSGEPALSLQSGYAFLIGRWPRVVSKWVQGAASGTELLLQIDTSTSSVETHRIFLVDFQAGQKITATALNPNTGVLIQPGVDITSEAYVEVKLNTLTGLPEVTGPFALSAASATIKTFVSDIKSRAAHQGLLPYPTSP